MSLGPDRTRNGVKPVRSAGDFNALLDEVHDWFFDLDALSWKNGTLTLALRPDVRSFGSSEGPKKLLSFKNVQGLEIFDSEGIGFYDINRLRFDERKRELTIETGVPLRFVLKVRELEIELEET